MPYGRHVECVAQQSVKSQRIARTDSVGDLFPNLFTVVLRQFTPERNSIKYFPTYIFYYVDLLLVLPCVITTRSHTAQYSHVPAENAGATRHYLNGCKHYTQHITHQHYSVQMTLLHL